MRSGVTSERILFYCDNMAVWRSGLSKAAFLMHLVRSLFFVAAKHNFHVSITHIAGVENSIAFSCRNSTFSLQMNQPSPSPPGSAHLSLGSLITSLMHDAIAPSTRKVYSAGVRLFKSSLSVSHMPCVIYRVRTHVLHCSAD